MSIVDDLVENIVERNGIRFTGALTIRLVDGGVSVSGNQIGLLTCGAGQVLKIVGGAWACAADADTSTTYTAAAGGGVSISGTQVGLATCPVGQILKAGVTAGAWACGADTDTNTTYTAGAGISLVTSPPGETWSQISALIVMAPCAWIGGRLAARTPVDS